MDRKKSTKNGSQVDGTKTGKEREAGSQRNGNKRGRVAGALNKEREIFETILEQSLAGYWDWMIQDGTEYLSPTFKRMFGYADHELPNEPETWQKLIFPEDLPGVMDVFNKHVASHGEFAYYSEVRYRHKNGSTVWVICTGRVVEWNAEGQPLRMVGCHIDITDRKQVQEALRVSEEKMRSIFRAAPTGIGVVMDRVLMDVNDRICEMTGYAKEELIGQSSRMLYPTQEDFDFVGREKYRQIAEGGTGQVETRWRKKDGSIIDVLLASTPIDVEDHSKGVTFTALDITERKKAADALLESHDRLHTILDSIDADIYVADLKTYEILFMNRHIRKTFGDNLVGLSCWQVFRGESGRCPNCTNDRLLDTDGNPTGLIVWEGQNPITGKSYINHDRAIKWTDGRLVHLQIATDITARIQAEEALRESEDKFKYVFDNSTVAKSITSVNSRLHANRAFCEMVGYSEEELENKPWREITHPDDIDLNLGEVNEILAGKKETARFIKRYIHKNGSVVWVDLSTSLRRDAVGNPLYFLTTALDITERKRAEEELRQSEERFELAMLAVNDGIWDWNIAEDRLYFDPRYYTMAGYEPNEFPHAFDEWRNRIHPDDVEHGIREVNAHLSGQTKVFDIEFRFLRKDGTWMWIRGRGRAVKHNENGKVARMIGTHTDITDRKRAEEELRQRENLLNKIFDVLPVGLWLADKNGKLTRSNRAGREIWGAEPLVGQEEYGVFKARRLPSGQEIAPEDWALARTIREGVTVLDEMLEIDSFDGKKKVILNYTAPVLDDTGEVDGAVIVNLDITERMKAEESIRKSERQMKALLTSLDDIVFEFDEDATYLNIWTADESLLAMPKSQMLGKQALEVMGEEQGTQLAKAIQRSLAEDTPQSIEYPLGVMGGQRWFLARINPILAPDSSTRTVSVLVRDITERRKIEAQIQVQLRRVRALNEIDRAISSSLDMQLSLDILLTQTISQLGVDAACVLLLNPSAQTLEFSTGKGFRSTTIRESRITLGQGLPGRAGLERKTMHVPDIKAEEDTFIREKLLKEEGFVEYFCVPLIAKGLLKGVLEIFNRSHLNPDMEWVNYLETLGGQAAIAIDNAQLFEGMQRSNLDLVFAYDATIEGWSRAMDLRDKETEGHTQRVTELTVKLGRRMGVSQQEVSHMRRGALLHDIGKLGVPDHILHKQQGLTEIEWAIMRQHPNHAFNMLVPIAYLRPAIDIPYCHHEKWDGTGYPRGLKGEEIPLAARIFAIVDVWDALRSDRPYRKGWPPDQVREHLIAESGKHFDPQVVEVFLALMGEAPDLF